MSSRQALALLLLGTAACGNSSEATTSTASTTGAGGTGGAAAVDTVGPGPAPVSVAATSSSGSGPDPGWTTLPWAQEGCGAEYAANPGAAFQPLEWVTCPGGEPGCEVLVRSFPQSIALIGYAPLSILQTADGIAIGLQVATAEGARAVVARPGGEPTHVYRNNRGECFASHLILTPAGHWFGEQLVETNRTESVYVFQPDGAPPAQAEVAPIDWLAAEHSGNELAFAARTDGPGRLAIFDRATGMVSTLKSSVGAARPTFDGNAAFFLGVEEYNHPLGWVWRSSDAAFEQLLDSGDEVVADLRSDGETLVWLQVPPPGEQGEWYAGTLYRSPRATHPDEVMATPVRPMVATGPVPPATIGAGRYAVYSPYTNALYVIRLDDGRLWTVPLPSAEIPGDVTDVSFIDDEVLYFKTETEIYRQRLDALGEGEAAPDP